MTLHPEHVAKDNSMEFLSDDGGVEYSESQLLFPLLSSISSLDASTSSSLLSPPRILPH